ncbi:MAG: FtsB family cell division protein [Opitutales bacterium]
MPRKERVLVFLLCVVFCAVLVAFGSLVVGKYRVYKNHREQENRTEARLAQARKAFEQKDVYVHRLLEEPDFLERVVRERLGYARPDEIVFRFPEE